MLGRPLTILLLGLLMLTLGALWFGKGGLSDQKVLRKRLKTVTAEKTELIRENNELKQALDQVRFNPDVIEARARMELGFVKNNEVFIQILPSKDLASKKDRPIGTPVPVRK
jgi:cell division protein FtsB